jgi:hypothetical protein
VICSLAQTETATVSGRVTDPQGALLVGAEVVVTNTDTNVRSHQTTNKDGLYVVSALKPGRYRITVSNAGFQTVNLMDVVLNVQDSLSENFKLRVGSISESVTVIADKAKMNTESATVSTVVDRNFAENLPMNGRSFQTLIQLTPGVVVTPVNQFEQGQFSVNGQRAASNYWMVDGAGANVGVSSGFSPGNGLTGSLPASSALGGTNSLVSVDAMQEFRIQTSTYAPEFGRSPGGQISILTRSGTNQFHGTAFDYIRNDVFDAADWFNGYTNNPPLPKAEERQNDFGATLGGPLLKDRTFFFFAYEGLQLRLPRTALTTVPDHNARQTASSAMQPFLNAYPLPNGPEDAANPGAAQFNSSFSNRASLNASSLRLDQRIGSKLALFGRYNYSPSNLMQRGGSFFSTNTVFESSIKTQTATAGATWAVCARVVNDLRFNYSRIDASSQYLSDSFGGAVPVSSLPLPPPHSLKDSLFVLFIFPLTNGVLAEGHNARTTQRQINIVDSLSTQKGSHALKFGVDFRRLAPIFAPATYTQQPTFLDMASAESGTLSDNFITSSQGETLLFRNLGAYAQDTWRLLPRLTVTYGLRWDVDFAPASTGGPSLPAVTGFSLNNFSTLALAPAGTPLYRTSYGNVAPRIGAAYEIFQNPGWETVLRGGFGVFFDLANSEVGNNISSSYPFFAFRDDVGGNFPPSVAPAPAPLIPTGATIDAVDPNLKLPHTLQWNLALEQALGKQQTISFSYVGSAGRRLIQSADVLAPTPDFSQASVVTNTATSDYHALQLQFQRQLSSGLQALASYTWSHSIDTASAGSIAVGGNAFVPSAVGGANRGSSDFDIRHAFSGGVTYDLPVAGHHAFSNAILGNWSVQSVIQVRSAPPVGIHDSKFFAFTGGIRGDIRPDLVPGKALYLQGSQYPGGRALNPSAFMDPPSDPNTGLPLRQGTTPRNLLRAFNAAQWDFGVHRSFPIHERLKLQFRAELFNILNHPNFGPPSGAFGSGGFGVSSQMLGRSLSGGNLSGGGLDPLYQVGGPRSAQFALKLTF